MNQTKIFLHYIKNIGYKFFNISIKCSKFVNESNKEDNYNVNKYLDKLISQSYALRFKGFPARIKNNKSLMLKMIARSPLMISYIGTVLQDDKEFILEAINKTNNALKYTSLRLKEDKEIVWKAINKSPWSLLYLTDKDKNDQDLVYHVVKKNSVCIQYASLEIRDNKEFILKSIEYADPNFLSVAIEHISERLKNDKEIALNAVKKAANCLQNISEALKNDKEVVLLALINNDRHYHLAGELLKEEIGDNDPVKYLKSLLLCEKLNQEIPNKEVTKKTKIKI